jgi:hypothetical protein
MIGSGSKIRIRIRFFQRSDPDPHQNDLDPQHCYELASLSHATPPFPTGHWALHAFGIIAVTQLKVRDIPVPVPIRNTAD